MAMYGCGHPGAHRLEAGAVGKRIRGHAVAVAMRGLDAERQPISLLSLVVVGIYS
jgi:hypothetical protein